MAIFPWVLTIGKLENFLAEAPHVAAWLETIRSRPAVGRALDAAKTIPESSVSDEDARKVLFGQQRRR